MLAGCCHQDQHHFCESKLCWSGLGGTIGVADAGGIGSVIGAVEFAADGGVAGGAFVGGCLHVGVVAAPVLACGSVISSLLAVPVSEYSRLGRSGSCGGTCGLLVAESLILLLGIWRDKLLRNNVGPVFFALHEGL